MRKFGVFKEVAATWKTRHLLMDLSHRPLNKSSFWDHLSCRIFKVHSVCLKTTALGNNWVKAVVGSSWKSGFTEGELTALNLILIKIWLQQFLTKHFFNNITSGLTYFSQYKNVRFLVLPSLCTQSFTGKWYRGNLPYFEMQINSRVLGLMLTSWYGPWSEKRLLWGNHQGKL